MKKLTIATLISILASLLAVTCAVAQAEQLSLRMSRDWGYGGLNGDIQGLFSMHVTGPAGLAKVIFYIDSNSIGEVDQAPFNLQFNTDNYSLGVHELYAVGSSAAGTEYRSNIIKANFVPASQGGKSVFVVLAIILVAILISAIVPFVASRKTVKLPMGAERSYGLRGGAICPKCHRPFALPFFSAHLGFSKLAVCPYCGKVGLVQPQSIEKLRQAEKAELTWAQPGLPDVASNDEKLKDDLDDSKYQGL